MDGWVTPRGGKAVEINALWYNAVCIAAELCDRFGRFDTAEELTQFAAIIKGAFNARFWNTNANCCYDVIDHLGADSLGPAQPTAGDFAAVPGADQPIVSTRCWKKCEPSC